MMEYGGFIERGEGGKVIAYYGALGLTIHAVISKNGGLFAASTNAIGEIGNGYYALDLTTTETNTNGPLVVHFSDGVTAISVLVLVESVIRRVDEIVKKWTTAQLNTPMATRIKDLDERLTGLIRNVIGSQLVDLKQQKVRGRGRQS